MDDGVATWHLIQYTADLRSREPRNVGVVLRAPEGEWSARFFGETAPGQTLGQKLRHLELRKRPYEAWLSFYRRKMLEDSWGDVEKAQLSRSSNFTVQFGGEIAQPDGTWADEVARLYSSLVSDVQVSSKSGSVGDLRTRARQVLDEAVSKIETEVRVPAAFGSRRATVTFDFRHVNGQPHLMQVVPLRGTTAIARANAFYGQVVAARDAGSASSFFAFYDSENVSAEGEQAEEVYAALEGVAHSVDLADLHSAVATVREATS